ncbi:hypothetical protein L218DRAFT_555112 [Marasmius fiardii PR-910]|nr:hypothetical protein L218DRAFT_555112 [Marasmius fiardii PR-910]
MTPNQIEVGKAEFVEAAPKVCGDLRYATEIEDLNKTLCPILKLPADLLLLIVKICANDDQDGHIFSMRTIQWVVSQTCRSWRDTALSSPSLWKVVRIDAKRYSYPTDSFSMLKTWLSRSRSAPISCCIVFSDWRPVDEDQLIEAGIMDLIIGDSHRWLAISLWLAERPDLYYRVGAIKIPLLLLRFFQIFAGAPEDYLRPFKASAFASAPNLTDVDINVDPALSPIPLPWHQLRRCSYLYASRLFENAISLQNLQHLTLSALHPIYSTGSPKQLSLTGLRRLEANLQTFRLVADLLDIIHLPSLRDLGVDPLFFDGVEALPLSIVNLQKRSSCRIKRISFPMDIMTTPGWQELARSVDTIEELHVRIHYYPLPLAENHHTPNLTSLHDRSVLPRLKNLYIVLHLSQLSPIHDDDTFFNALADIATARRAPDQFDVQLERLSIDTAVAYDLMLKDWVKPILPVHVQGMQRVIGLQSQGLVLSEPFALHRWSPVHRRATHWDAEITDLDANRYYL